ncbi:MAG TPA: hypothetical protein PKL15_16710, partial [Saprospiraceae bacterium]|nr:hypothetical protein [Saprospiraceae bacterium]
MDSQQQCDGKKTKHTRMNLTGKVGQTSETRHRNPSECAGSFCSNAAIPIFHSSESFRRLSSLRQQGSTFSGRGLDKAGKPDVHLLSK